jgi:hypothetical protein
MDHPGQSRLLGTTLTRIEPPTAIGFAEKLIELLDEGRYTSTYKFAVLLALMDLCLEGTAASGAPPDVLTTRQIAARVVEGYWPHTVPFVGREPALVLRQNTRGQAEILSIIRRFREQHAPDPSVPHWESRLAAPDRYERLVRDVEWKLIQMPLPRLQTMGNAQRRFIYEINWDDRVARAVVNAYQSGQPLAFDNRVLLRPGVGEYFVQLSGLLRPLIQRQWAAKIAQMNALEQSQLEIFLFGAVRAATARVRGGLWEMQGRRCFYCDARIDDHNRDVLPAYEVRRVRKLVKQCTSHSRTDFRELIRERPDPIHRTTDLLGESHPKPFVFAPVPGRCVLNVDFGKPADDDRNHPFRLRFNRSALTSAQGRPSSGFASRSASRSSRTSRCQSGTGT